MQMRNSMIRHLMVGAALSLTAGLASAQQAPGGGQGGPPADYNISARSDADKALPNPYARDETFFKIPKSMTLGGTSGIDFDKDGKSIWITQRCGGQDYCIGSDADPIWKFDAQGRVVKHFGAGLITYPHGLHVDREGAIWIADVRTNTHEQQGQSAKRLPAPNPTAPRWSSSVQTERC